jgi:hypothetical protein
VTQPRRQPSSYSGSGGIVNKAANILNKESRTVDNGWPPNLAIGPAANTENNIKYKILVRKPEEKRPLEEI